MAATKRLHVEEEANGAPDLAKPSKKQKVKEVSAAGDDDAAAALKKQKKKEKKEKKAKKEATEEATEESEEKSEEQKKADKKRRKEEKREKKRLQEEAAAAAATATEDVAMTEATSEEAAAPEEPSKKKEKKEKKDKKKKKDSAEEAQPTTTTAAAEPSNGLYKQTDSLMALPQSDIDAFFSQHSIIVDDTKTDKATALRPVIAFSHLPTTDLLRKSPFTAYKTPTPIQAASWPWTLSGRDAVGVAETGSGKTMAFALPLVETLYRLAQTKGKKQQRGVKAVVVSPTRELAMQTHEQTAQLASLVGLKCVCVYGGSPKEEQRALIQRGADIIVATPGRLKDFMSDGTVELGAARFAVLDEADRMLDKGFEDDIKAILGAMPPREERQTLMFTATWPTSVRVLASTFMVDPVKITIGRPIDESTGNAGAEQLQANSRISQTVEVMDGRDKERRLLQILKQYQAKGKNDRMLVFCLYKKEATRVEGFLQQRGISVCGIHGDLRQEQRTRSLEAFKSGQTPVLVATDVAARGLDIPEVKLVINVTFPLTIEDYVHRIGRTGRAGKTGEAITFFTQQDKAHSGALINILKGANQPVPDELFKFGTTVKKKAHDTYGAFFKDVDMSKKATKITFD
ncbi:ATP-dependent RNA helicase DBP3 [Plectosphaerella cucumerina]|uniref:RNA helicase n=1 Tax=Plectosphaerella cucumerina TaxID=40658 RepID=A0A8K0T8W6_9PEZI|nr:ATP-dependent RNA helicase DBP3 [Plectosphaerella cucumerina]